MLYCIYGSSSLILDFVVPSEAHVIQLKDKNWKTVEQGCKDYNQ